MYDVTSGLSKVVSVTTQPTFTVGKPAILPRGIISFASEAMNRPVDMAPDGRIVGVIQGDSADSGGLPNQIYFVQNWFEELKQRVPR